MPEHFFGCSKIYKSKTKNKTSSYPTSYIYLLLSALPHWSNCLFFKGEGPICCVIPLKLNNFLLLNHLNTPKTQGGIKQSYLSDFFLISQQDWILNASLFKMLFPALKLFLCKIFCILFKITTKEQDIILPCWPCQFCTDHKTEMTSQFLYLELPQIIQGFYEFLFAGNLQQSWRKVTQRVLFHHPSLDTVPHSVAIMYIFYISPKCMNLASNTF